MCLLVVMRFRTLVAETLLRRADSAYDVTDRINAQDEPTTCADAWENLRTISLSKAISSLNEI